MADRPQLHSAISPRMTIDAATHGTQKPSGQVVLSVMSPAERTPTSADSTTLNLRRLFRRRRGKEIPPSPESASTDGSGQTLDDGLAPAPSS